MRERIFQQCLSASIRMILPPPKFLDAMPERRAGKPKTSTFSRPTYPAAFHREHVEDQQRLVHVLLKGTATDKHR